MFDWTNHFEAVTMATAASVSDYSTKVMEKGLTCYICYNLLREPKDLDCPHVYCLQCLQEWVKKKPTVECPECRKITIVPQGGLVNLKTNFRLKTIVDDYVHEADNRKIRGVPICPNHDGERQHFFCVTCGITVCHNCLVLDHPRPQHDIKELKVFTKIRMEQMKTKMEHVQEEMERTRIEKQELIEMERKLQEAKEKAKSDIKKQVQQVMSKVEAKERQMMELVETNYQKNLSTVQEKQSQIEDRLSCLQNVHSVTRNIVDTVADHNLIKQTTSLVDQMENLCLTHHSGASSLNLDSLVFTPGSGLQDMSWLGHVGSYRQTPRVGLQANTRQSEAPSLDMDSAQVNPRSRLHNASQIGYIVSYSKNTCKLKLISEFGEFQFAHGVAATRTGLLAVVDYNAKAVSIYRKDNGDFKRQYRLGSSQSNGNVTRPKAIAVTSDGKFFICDDGVVKVFSPDGRYERSWPKSVDATRITTTPDDMIVIGSSTQKVISVHQSNGEMIRTHQADCKEIIDIASNGKQIAFTTGTKRKVYVIDFVTGQTLWKVDMVWPLGICYEQRSNTLLVAGGSYHSGQRVIEQYCSTTGHLIWHLASGLYAPWAMTTTHENKLVVADGKTVKVYQIEYE